MKLDKYLSKEDQQKICDLYVFGYPELAFLLTSLKAKNLPRLFKKRTLHQLKNHLQIQA